jgi:hypothetical protein
LPPLAPLEVHMVVSPEGIPVPDQLQDEAGQTTARILFAPERLMVTDVPWVEAPLKVAGRAVPLDPNWDHATESLAGNPDDEVTSDKESAYACLEKNTTQSISRIADRSAAAASWRGKTARFIVPP